MIFVLIKRFVTVSLELFKFLFLFNMEYIKGVLVLTDSNVVLEIPKDWKIRVASEKFLVCKNVAGKETAYNVNSIISITEISDEMYKNTLTRIELERQRAEAQTLGKPEAKLSKKK